MPGYETQVRHRGKLYLITTEDLNGVVLTQLFHQGELVTSRQTAYPRGTSRARVKQLSRDSHKAVFIALREGAADEPERAGGGPGSSSGGSSSAPANATVTPTGPRDDPPV